MAGHHHDFGAGHGRILEDVQAVAARQADIGQHQVRRLPFQLYQRIFDAACHCHRKTAVAAHFGQCFPDRVVVIDDKQMRHSFSV
ncbi:hypothetical protein D3C73_1535250 [compost metagenome]